MIIILCLELYPQNVFFLYPTFLVYQTAQSESPDALRQVTPDRTWVVATSCDQGSFVVGVGPPKNGGLVIDPHNQETYGNMGI